jgi:hypothetical protein
MKVFAGLTMQKTNYQPSFPGSSVIDTEYRFDVLDFPGQDRVRREDVILKMMDRMPESVRSGAVIFFMAESEFIT